MKNLIGMIPILILTMFVMSCATTYGPAGGSGGYSHAMLTPNTAEVRFEGNGRNSADQIRTYLMYHCAELTLEKNYTHFLILEDRSFQDAAANEFDETDIQFETRTSMSGGVQSSVSSTFGAQPAASNTIGVFEIMMRTGPDPTYPSASNDARAYMEANKKEIKFRK